MEDIKYLNAGANGFTFKFGCGLIKKVAKFFYCYSGRENYDKDFDACKENANIEFEKINLMRSIPGIFARKYIMQGESKFYFDAQTMNLNIIDNTGKVTTMKLRRPEDIILYDEATNFHTVFENIPSFSGVILENIMYNFNQLSICTIQNIYDLLIQYLIAINELNKNNFCHNDIKNDNLMFNMVEGRSEAKIIDLDLDNMATINEVSPRSFGYANINSINKTNELLKRFPVSIGDKRNKEQMDIIMKIASSNDIYMLLVAFKLELESTMNEMYHGILSLIYEIIIYSPVHNSFNLFREPYNDYSPTDFINFFIENYRTIIM
jgi:hypothetical protein